MKLLENLKLDKWYGIILYVGLLMVGASLYLKVDFIEMKHLFGLGLGFFIIGLSFFMAEKHYHEKMTGGIFSTMIIQHNSFSRLLMILGVGLVLLFGFLVIKKLI